MNIFKKLKSMIFWAVLIIITLVLTFSLYVLLGSIQEKIFVPDEYLIWISKYPFSLIFLIFEIYIVMALMFVFNKDYKELVPDLKRYINKKSVSIFTALNMILLYLMLVNVAVITDDKIINHTFLSPGGKAYSFNDIEKINTGVTGKKPHFIFSHYSKGDFYYIIKLRDGTRIYLTDVGGTRDEEHETFIIERLDRQFVNMGIPKTSSMDNFEYSKNGLDEIYTDKIRSILLNTRKPL